MGPPAALSPGALSDALSPEAACSSLAVDVRRPAEFAAGHLPRSVQLTFNPVDLAARASALLPPGVPLALVGETDAQSAAASNVLDEAGLSCIGWLEGGFRAWEAAGLEVARVPALEVTSLLEQLDRYALVDVREPFEFERGHIAGATLLPSRAFRVGELPDMSGLGGDGRTLAVLCATGPRATFVTSLLAREGLDVTLVLGGMGEWADRGYPVVTG